MIFSNIPTLHSQLVKKILNKCITPMGKREFNLLLVKPTTDIKYLKKEYLDEWINFKDKFGEYADIWRIEYPHKRYRIKRNVVLDNSPLSLLDKFPNMGKFH